MLARPLDWSCPGGTCLPSKLELPESQAPGQEASLSGGHGVGEHVRAGADKHLGDSVRAGVWAGGWVECCGWVDWKIDDGRMESWACLWPADGDGGQRPIPSNQNCCPKH